MNPKIAALDRVFADRLEAERDRRPATCGRCGCVITEGAKSEAGYDAQGRYYTRGPFCDPCGRLERAAAMAMAKGAA